MEMAAPDGRHIANRKRQVFMRREATCVLLVLMVGMAVSGCTSSQPQRTSPTAQLPPYAAAALRGDAAPQLADDYKIGPLDKISVSVFQVPDLDTTAEVNKSGYITFPLIGQVMVAGKTAPQLEKEIAAKLGATYLQSPQVSVKVTDYTSQRVTVDGAVQKPGIFPMTGSVSLLQAVASAQGLTEYADQGSVYVFRLANGKRTASHYDLSSIRSGKSPDPILQGGDVVIVDESGVRTTLRDLKYVSPLAALAAVL